MPSDVENRASFKDLTVAQKVYGACILFLDPAIILLILAFDVPVSGGVTLFAIPGFAILFCVHTWLHMYFIADIELTYGDLLAVGSNTSWALVLLRATLVVIAISAWAAAELVPYTLAAYFVFIALSLYALIAVANSLGLVIRFYTRFQTRNKR